MSQSIEITEEKVNGTTHTTPITKSYNTAFIKSTRVNGSKCELELMGKNTKDIRLVSETNAAVLAAANAAPTTEIETLLAVTVKKVDGDLESRVTPYAENLAKATIVEYFADPKDATDSIVVVAVDRNTIDRKFYTVDETYAALKAKWLL
jgi:hypothetical protein